MKSQIRNLYPILQNEDFRIYIINQQRRFEEVPFSSLFLKEKKYTGTVIIKICEKQEINSIAAVWTILKGTLTRLVKLLTISFYPELLYISSMKPTFNRTTIFKIIVHGIELHASFEERENKQKNTKFLFKN